MGISGTQVAINASDIVLMDDNFASIVSAIKWGRNVLNSVRKFLQFQLSVNFVAVFITIISSATDGVPIIKPAALLWINLIMDSLGALSLASEKPTDVILLQKPHKRQAKMLNGDMQNYILMQTVYQTIVLVVLQHVLDPKLLNSSISDEDVKAHVSTIVFSSFVLLQVANQTAARNLKHEVAMFKGIFANRYFLWVQLIIITVQVLIVQFLSSAFELKPLSFWEWAFCLGIAASDLLYIFIVRLAIQGKRALSVKKMKKRVDTEIGGEMKKAKKAQENRFK
jgi:magnesium-transporting ATPase (P-type)